MENAKKKNLTLIFIIVAVVLGILLYSLSRNKTDPDWTNLDKMLSGLDTIASIENSPREMQALFDSFHSGNPDSVDVMKLIGTPYIPIMRLSKFAGFVNMLKKEKRIVLTSVEGGGATTLTDKLAKFIGVKDSHILKIMCAPNFDLKYNKELIGEVQDGQFKKGALLRYWEECARRPEEKFVLVFDNFDKVNPETVLGPQIWENMVSSHDKIVLYGDTIVIPPNLYMISIISSYMPGGHKFSNEHFKRLGRNLHIGPSVYELAVYLRKKKKRLLAKASHLDERKQKDLAALQDDNNVFAYLYTFSEANQLIANKLASQLQLGPWSNLRKLYRPSDRKEMIDVFVNHVNAGLSDKEIDADFFDPVFYALSHKGKQAGSSPLAVGFRIFKDWGFLTETTVALTFAIVTFLLGIYFSAKRKKKIERFVTSANSIYNSFLDRQLNTNKALNELEALQTMVNEQVGKGKINFSEAVFFYNNITNKVNSIEMTKNINATFLVLMDVFLDDQILSHNEYRKLIEFLNRIQTKIPEEDFNRMMHQVEEAWEKYGEAG